MSLLFSALETKPLCEAYGEELVSTHLGFNDLFSERILPKIRTIANYRGALLIRGVDIDNFVNFKEGRLRKIKYHTGTKYEEIEFMQTGRGDGDEEHVLTEFWHCDTYYPNGLMILYKPEKIPGEANTLFSRRSDVLPVFLSECAKLETRLITEGHDFDETFATEYLKDCDKMGKLDLLGPYVMFFEERPTDPGDLIQAIQVVRESLKKNYPSEVRSSVISDLSRLLSYFPEETREFRERTAQVPNSYNHTWKSGDLMFLPSSETFLHRKLVIDGNNNTEIIARFKLKFD